MIGSIDGLGEGTVLLGSNLVILHDPSFIDKPLSDGFFILVFVHSNLDVAIASASTLHCINLHLRCNNMLNPSSFLEFKLICVGAKVRKDDVDYLTLVLGLIVELVCIGSLNIFNLRGKIL